MEIAITFPTGRGVDWWTRRNADSPIPGRWPYGLDRIAAGSGAAHQVEAVEVGDLGRARRLIASRAGFAALAARRRPGRVAMCWDESLAPAMLTQVPAERRFAGVIWATDRLAALGPTPELVLIRDALRRMDGLWVLSRPQIAAVRDWLGADCPPVHFLRFGVDPDFYARTDYPETSGPVVVSIGGDRDRDPQTLFAALEMVRQTRPDVRCIVQSKSELAAPEGIEKESFVPHDRVRQLYAEASVVAIATRPNLHGSGMTVGLEAMAVGRPVIASATPGMDDYVTDAETGYLVPPRDPDTLAERILALLTNPVTAAEMGARGHEQVMRQHTTDAMCADLLEILTS